MRRAVLLAAAFGAALSAGPAQAQEATGRLLVTLEPGARAAQALTGATRSAAPGVPQLRLVVVRGDAQTARRLRARPGVARVEPDRLHRLRFVPNDPAVSEQEPATGAPPGLAIQWWLARTGLFGAWDVTNGAGAKVAIIDSGIDATHPDLASQIEQASDLSFSREGARVDTTGHGTHVASMACAAGHNALGMAGAGLGCRLLVYKSDLSDSSIISAIVDATDAGAHAINMSFGTDGTSPASQSLVDALRYAQRRQVVLVAAAADEAVQEQGDPSNVLQPTGTGPDLTSNGGLSVTAATVDDQRASFAGFGSQISLAAYGAYGRAGGPRGLFGAFPVNETDLERGSVSPAVRPCQCRTTYGGDRRYAYLQGTSMAAPQVAAVAALVRELNPDLPAADVVRLLKETARRPAGTGWEPNLGWGVLDAAKAIETARTIDRRAPESTATAPRTTRRRKLTVRLRSADTVADARLTASGVRAVELYRSADGGPFRRIARTRKPTYTLKVVPGRTYAFQTIAVDRAGNREGPPARPDARVRVARRAR